MAMSTLKFWLIVGLVCMLTINQVSSDREKHHDDDDDDDDDDHHQRRKQPERHHKQRDEDEDEDAHHYKVGHHNDRHHHDDDDHDNDDRHKQPRNQYRPGRPNHQTQQSRPFQPSNVVAVVSTGQMGAQRGPRQSPIDIRRQQTERRPDVRPLELHYGGSMSRLNLSNSGTTWEVRVPHEAGSTLFGGRLANEYQLEAFHSHWGDRDNQGSEHTVDGASYSGELHFVHYDKRRYGSFERAKRAEPDGLAVLAVFLDARSGNSDHLELEKIVAELARVQSKGQSVLLRQPVNLNRLLPRNRSYWSYAGSLTTPNYNEVVTWFVLKEPIRVSRAQLDKFRRLSSGGLSGRDTRPIKENFRAPQALNGRTVVSYDERTGYA